MPLVDQDNCYPRGNYSCRTAKFFQDLVTNTLNNIVWKAWMEAWGKEIYILTKPDNNKRKSDAKKEFKEKLKAFLMSSVSADVYMRDEKGLTRSLVSTISLRHTILYSLRVITSEHAGNATSKPMLKWVAGKKDDYLEFRMQIMLYAVLTYIAPDWCNVVDIIREHCGVDTCFHCN